MFDVEVVFFVWLLWLCCCLWLVWFGSFFLMEMRND